jgi:hypothetical protein
MQLKQKICAIMAIALLDLSTIKAMHIQPMNTVMVKYISLHDEANFAQYLVNRKREYIKDVENWKDWPPEKQVGYYKLTCAISDIGDDALFYASRSPNKAEKQYAKKLALSLKTGNLANAPIEVRIVDEYSLLQSLRLPNETKILFWCLLRCDANVADSFISACVFSDSRLKKLISDDIAKGCRESKIYRNLIILAWAWSLAEPNLCDMVCVNDATETVLDRRLRPIQASHRQFNFAFGPESDSYYNTINMDYNSICYLRSLIANRFGLQAPNGLWYNKEHEYRTLFHEIGHSILSTSVNCLNRTLEVEQMTMRFVSSFMNAKVNEEGFEQRCKEILSMPEGKRNEIISDFKKNFPDVTADTTEDFLAWSKEQAASAEKITRILLSNMHEVWQICGCLVVLRADKVTLFINKLSDFDFLSEIGAPLRNDHLGAYKDELVNLNFQKAPVNYSMNKEVYSTYSGLHGFNFDDYMARIAWLNLTLREVDWPLQRLWRQITLPIFIDEDAYAVLNIKISRF